jgi:two-component system chemotaxis response regulator CheV
MSQTKILLEVGTNELEIVEFYINEKDGYRGYYGINVSKVVEIIRSQPVTAMPQMRHPSVLGAFPYRGGRIVPLIDLAKFLEKESVEADDPKIIITEFNNVQNSFLVSGVTRIHRISWQRVEAPTEFMLGMSRKSITGVVRLEDRVVFLLDMEAIVGTLHPSLGIQMDVDPNAPKPRTSYHILHADDSASIRSLVYEKLLAEGRFTVSQVHDGQQAWDTLKGFRDQAAADGKPITDYLQGIITDIEMPNMDGLTLCKYIKEDPVLRQLPVAMFSSLISPSLAHKCESVHADAQFSKPDLQAISDKMYELLGDFMQNV